MDQKITTIRNVVVLGATGTLGRPIVRALQEAGFQVTAVTRTTSTTFPDGVQVVQADISREADLIRAFTAKDAVVEALNPSAISHQKVIIDAALNSGIKHIITPEFAGDTFGPSIEELKIYEPKITAQRVLMEKVSGASFKWTAVITGPWYDWAIANGHFWINTQNREVKVFGSGNQHYSMSKIGTVVGAVVDVLQNPQKFANRPIYIADYTVSTNEIIPILESISPGWKIEEIKIDNFFDQAKHLWENDTEARVVDRLGTRAYMMLGTYGIFEEKNRHNADYREKVEPGYLKDLSLLKEELKDLIK